MGETAGGTSGDGDRSRYGYSRRCGCGYGSSGRDARGEGSANEGGEDWSGCAAEEEAAAGVKAPPKLSSYQLTFLGAVASGVSGQG